MAHRTHNSGYLNKALYVLLVLPLCWGIAELTLRTLILSKMKWVRNPALYVSTLDPDYWKLNYLWNKEQLGQHNKFPKEKNETLGWIGRVTDSNPLGLANRTPYSVPIAENGIFFFGDSFMQGVNPGRSALPELIEKLTHRSSYNFGVGGYGLDQIVLRFKIEAEKHPFSEAVIGILVDDVARTLLPFRERLKPFFVEKDGQWELHQEHLTLSEEEYLALHPIAWKSYAAKLLVRTLETRGLLKDPDGPRIETATRLCEMLIDDLEKKANAKKIRLTYLIFYARGDYGRPTWQEIAIKKRLGRSQFSVLDTKPFILTAAGGNGVKLTPFFEGGHPSLKMDELVARNLVEVLPRAPKK